MIDLRGWLIWSASAMTVALSTRNPLYLLLLLLLATAVARVHARGEGRRLPLGPWRFALIVIASSAMFNALTIRLGETVLLRLPEWLPLLGGVITLEALVYGGTGGLTLAAIFAVFVVFNGVVAASELVRLAPRALHEAGVVASIALTFVPQTTAAVARIRQAQALRGHRIRGLADWRPIFLPLVVSGLERSTGLAEAMVARGYGAVGEGAQPGGVRGALVLGLAALLGGWLGRVFAPEAADVASAALVGGLVLLAIAFWRAGRAHRHSVYRDRRWTRADGLVAIGCALAMAAVLIPLPFIDRGTLAFVPYPRLGIPAFDPILGLALLGLLTPAFLSRHTA